jgi:CHAD domain-containing protein
VTTAGDGPSATSGREVELKYRVTDLATGERLVGTDKLAGLTATGGRVRSVQVEDRYVDTADGRLRRAGFVARLRQRGDETLVSLKSVEHEDGPGGSYRRLELEGPADRVAKAADWPASDARSLVLEHAGDAPFVETVTIRQLRRKRVLKTGSTRVELSLDEIDVVHRGRIAASFVELEAEVLKGDEDVLARLAAVLDTEAGLVRSTESKLEAAMAALSAAADPEADEATPPKRRGRDRDGGDAAVMADTTDGRDAEPEAPAPRLVVGKTPGVLPDDHVAEAGRKVLRFHLARMLDYEPGTRTGEHAEDLHKMRVATRRQRAAWRVFGEGFRDGRTRRYRTGLREVAARLGAVRDLDVQLEAADAYRADLPVVEQRALEPLLIAWRGHRDDARRLLLRELDGDRYRRWLDDYLDFVRTEGAAVRAVVPTTPHRVRDTAPSRIWAAYEGVRAYEPVLRWADVETLHDLRISGKWLRYTLEFVREALGPEATPLITRVTALQDHIGLMHDADLTASLARTFLVEHGSSLSQVETSAIGRYLVDRERETARLRRTIGVPWRGIVGPGFRRGLGRVVAGL